MDEIQHDRFFMEIALILDLFAVYIPTIYIFIDEPRCETQMYCLKLAVHNNLYSFYNWFFGFFAFVLFLFIILQFIIVFKSNLSIKI